MKLKPPLGGWGVISNEQRVMSNMTRNDFFKKLGRYLLLLLMAIVVISLGKKVISGNDCTACPGKGICNGKTDCNKY